MTVRIFRTTRISDYEDFTMISEAIQKRCHRYPVFQNAKEQTPIKPPLISDGKEMPRETT